MDAGSLDRSCSRPTNASLRRREIGRKRQILRPPCNSSDPFRYRTLTYVRNANKRTVIVGLRSNYYSARLKSDLGFPLDRRFRLANIGGATQPDYALGAGLDLA
jgi:hypothetical protein